jgi:AcrR family transcriptional regulator
MDTPFPQDPTDKGWRGSAELWLDAAYEVLIDSGVEAVKVMGLAARLGLSRTSFYWHFTDREALLAALINRWRHRNTDQLIAHCEAPAESVTEAILNVFDCWINPNLFDSRLEFAIRNWALTDPALAEVLAEADATRLAGLRALFLRHGFGESEADIRAHTVYLTQIGYIAMKTEEALDPRLARIPSYALTFTGRQPLPDEVTAFRARHLAPSPNCASNF